jgi:hypothetical protein
MANGSVLSQSSTILRDGDRNDSDAGAIILIALGLVRDVARMA